MGCSFGTNYNDNIPFYQEINEDHSNGYTYPDSGFYYTYKFANYHDKIDNRDKVLLQFLDQGIVVYNAWYSEGSNGCSISGDGYTTAIHYPVFLIMTKDVYPELNEKNFSQISSPYPICICGKHVLRYCLVNY